MTKQQQKNEAWKLCNETIAPARKLYEAKLKEIEQEIIEVDGKRYQLIEEEV